MRPLFLIAASLAAAGFVEYDLPGTGQAHYRSAELRRSRAAVLVFLATDCPICNRYSPLLHRLETEYRARGVPFFAVFSEGSMTSDAARRYLSEFALEMPGLVDVHASLARQTGARVTPEAVILSPAGAILYRGRLDDQYVDWGKTRPAATQHDLHDALDALLAGKPVPHPVTKALGCALPGF